MFLLQSFLQRKIISFLHLERAGRIDPKGLWFFIPALAGIGGSTATGTAAGISWGTAILGGIGLGVLMSTPGSSPYTGDRQKEYKRMKNSCEKQPKQTGNKCSDLSQQIDHALNCANWYSWWDAKWLPGRHAIKINNFLIRAKNLKEQYKRECENRCQ